MRGPQSAQSVPRAQSDHMEPGPPSSQRPFEAQWPDGCGVHVSRHWALGRNEGAGGGIMRGPQSAQSVPRAQCEDSEPGPPSLHCPFEA